MKAVKPPVALVNSTVASPNATGQSQATANERWQPEAQYAKASQVCTEQLTCHQCTAQCDNVPAQASKLLSAQQGPNGTLQTPGSGPLRPQNVSVRLPSIRPAASPLSGARQPAARQQHSSLGQLDGNVGEQLGLGARGKTPTCRVVRTHAAAVLQQRAFSGSSRAELPGTYPASSPRKVCILKGTAVIDTLLLACLSGIICIPFPHIPYTRRRTNGLRQGSDTATASIP